MNEAEIYAEEENILQAAAQHQDRLAQDERLRSILLKVRILVSFAARHDMKAGLASDDIDFIATMCGVSD